MTTDEEKCLWDKIADAVNGNEAIHDIIAIIKQREQKAREDERKEMRNFGDYKHEKVIEDKNKQIAELKELLIRAKSCFAKSIDKRGKLWKDIENVEKTLKEKEVDE